MTVIGVNFMEVIAVVKMDQILRSIIAKLKKPLDCAPESQIPKLREMFSALPDAPHHKGKAPEWAKSEQQTDGQSGESSS